MLCLATEPIQLRLKLYSPNSSRAVRCNGSLDYSAAASYARCLVLGRTAEQELLAAERHAALREALSCLPPSCQQLMAMLTQDPPVPYAKISARLGIPVGSIGPTRRRCLDKLRRYPAIAALINAEAGTAT